MTDKNNSGFSSEVFQKVTTACIFSKSLRYSAIGNAIQQLAIISFFLPMCVVTVCPISTYNKQYHRILVISPGLIQFRGNREGKHVKSLSIEIKFSGY